MTLIVNSVSIACLWLLLVATITAQRPRDQQAGEDTICGQTLEFKNELMDRIEPLEYTFRRISISGNEFFRDKELRRHILFVEGDIFKRKRLIGSINKISKLKKIYPITLGNVALYADDRTKDVDIVFCVKERPR